jgi:hypothetical protein
MPAEEWRPVVTHVGRYEISDRGRVRTVARDIPSPRHGVGAMRRLESVILAQTVGGRVKNYKRVMLMGPRRHAYIHHLMAEAFIGPRPEGAQVLHKDDDGFHNDLDNIRYGNREENDMDRHVARVADSCEPAPF